MKKILITLLIVMLAICGFIYYLAYHFDPFALDEEKIIKETRIAFKEAQFEEDPYLEKEKIQDLTNFLLRNVNRLREYKMHEEYKKIQLAEGRWTSHYTNKGDCFGMPTFDRSFINDYISPEMIDSLDHYSNGLKGRIIEGFSVCRANSKKSIDSTKGSVSYFLSYKKKDKMNPNYYLNHRISQNKRIRLKDTIETIRDAGLVKDTVFYNDLRYTISVSPYSGF